ncbi:MAG TPA: PilN domain-containing protein [Pontiella sp.]
MHIRDKIITAACRIQDGIEWTTLRIKDGTYEIACQGALSSTAHTEMDAEDTVAAMQLPTELSASLKGDLTVALRTAELLTRTMEFPTSDPEEIAEMVGFQIDKISPYPLDQLDLSYEILRTTETGSLVLMVGAKRESIDSIGDTFEEKGVQIHRIDARILGWIHLLRDGGHISNDNCEFLIVDDDIDCSLVLLHKGSPLVLRSLHVHLNAEDLVDELVHELNYTLTTLDAEHDLPSPTAIHFWSNAEISKIVSSELTERCGIDVHTHTLIALPPLSEGMVRRTLDKNECIELIPREWVEYEERKRLIKKFFLSSASIASIWLIVLLSFYTIYKIRDFQYAAVKKKAEAIAPAAQQARQNQEKLQALRAYTDRSQSSLECLREVTQLLPIGDIEFVSYSYTKGKGVSLRGTASNDTLVNDFFLVLSNSKFFEQLKDQSVTTKTTKGVRRAVFSATLELPTKEDQE